MATRWSAHFSAGGSGENRCSKENGVGQRKRWLTRGADALWSSLCFKFEVASECRWDPILVRTPTVPILLPTIMDQLKYRTNLFPNARLRNCLSDRPLGLNAFKPGPLRCEQSSVIIMKFGTFAAPKVPNPCTSWSWDSLSPHFSGLFLTAGLVFFPAIRIDS